MRLDAGGIAKGYALDEAMRVLRGSGVKRAMILAGGDMIFGDPPPDRKGWQIELPGYVRASGPPVLSLANCALATSGDLVQFVELEGVRYSHIIDPRTGIGLTNRSLVHVIAPKGIDADGLSTAISVLGPGKGLSLIRQFRGAEFRLTQIGGANPPVVESSRFARHLLKESP
jgi:thiamine biosynthesis lipoprotein